MSILLFLSFYFAAHPFQSMLLGAFIGYIITSIIISTILHIVSKKKGLIIGAFHIGFIASLWIIPITFLGSFAQLIAGPLISFILQILSFLLIGLNIQNSLKKIDIDTETSKKIAINTIFLSIVFLIILSLCLYYGIRFLF